jgi:hypothetical protein
MTGGLVPNWSSCAVEPNLMASLAEMAGKDTSVGGNPSISMTYNTQWHVHIGNIILIAPCCLSLSSQKKNLISHIDHCVLFLESHVIFNETCDSTKTLSFNFHSFHALCLKRKLISIVKLCPMQSKHKQLMKKFMTTIVAQQRWEENPVPPSVAFCS